MQAVSPKMISTVSSIICTVGPKPSRTSYLLQMMNVHSASRRKATTSHNRPVCVKYYLPDVHGNKVRICTAAFLSASRVSSDRIQRVARHHVANNGKWFPRERRGGYIVILKFKLRSRNPVLSNVVRVTMAAQKAYGNTCHRNSTLRWCTEYGQAAEYIKMGIFDKSNYIVNTGTIEQFFQCTTKMILLAKIIKLWTFYENVVHS